MFAPHYVITPAMTRALMSIEADRQAMAELPLDVDVLAGLHESARLTSTHYSTQIEGNRLTQAQVKEVLEGSSVHLPGRERDELEVRHYYAALAEVEKLAKRKGQLKEADVRRIHGLVMRGRAVATPYRDGQNVIRDSVTRRIVYMPPEARDVSRLMRELVAWMNGEMEQGELPAPLIAALAHYEFATIHPYYDGNGRTARLLTTLILHRSGYGLKGIYSLDEYYARNLAGYYAALAVGPSHNYYLGRAEADVTGFVSYFCQGMAEAFGAIRRQASRAAERGAKDRAAEMRALDLRQRRLLTLFKRSQIVTAAEMARHLGLSHRTILEYCRKWVAVEFLEMQDASKKKRSYRLGKRYLEWIA
ncbi:MAG TPA: Fic family protein [Phycisphaerae bacterium]|jgi:Fic family protein|nr:Fic family protein [Phycisphaerae bacterium]